MSIDAKYYLHESDEAALEALKKIPGFSSLIKSFMKDWSERQAHLRSMSSFIRINENQLSKYYDMLPPICEKLGIEVPELYLMMDVNPNAFTTGETKPQIVITSGLIDKLPEELIPTVLAHECGHIACHHVLYRMIGSILIGGTASTISRLPLGGLISLPIQMAFFYWMRCSEYSADRAAMICDGTGEKMIEVCMRLAGYDKNIADNMNKEEYLKQAEEYKKLVSDNKWDKSLEFYMLSGTSHPFTAIRALECREWENSEQFRHLMDGTFVEYTREMKREKYTTKPSNNPIFPDISDLLGKITNQAKINKCPHCEKELEGDEKYCPYCGKLIK